MNGLAKHAMQALEKLGRLIATPFERSHRRRVFDCFMLNQELDILEVRLSELFNVVDVFVVIEASATHQGQRKPLHYHENVKRFAKFAKKVRCIAVSDLPMGDDHWARERYQRQVLRQGISDADLDDIIIVSDVDEIPSADAVRQAVQKNKFVFLELMLNYYYFNLTGGHWLKAYAAPKAVIDRMPDLSLPRWQEAEYLAEIGGSFDDVIRNAGWHLTWQGGVQKIMDKLDAFAHAEFQIYRNRALLERAIAERRFFIGDVLLKEVPTKDLPATVRADLPRFNNYLAPASH